MSSPIGVFDSGVGGLSVVRELRRLLPQESILYYADQAFCPYGERSHAEIQARATAITSELVTAGAKLIVVACNTATIAAVEYLRAHWPLPIVGMEPAVKPAVVATRSGIVGVLATGAALAGDKFHRLAAQHGAGVRLITQPCPGLVEQVERGELNSGTTVALVRRYVGPLVEAGADALVLGCTHYPFLRPLIEDCAGPGITVIDTGEAVARQARRLLERECLLAAPSEVSGSFSWRTSGDTAVAAPIVERLLELAG